MITDRALDLIDALRAHGYCVLSQPADGQEAEYEAGLKRALTSVQETLAQLQRVHGYRGRSANALSALHSRLPEPGFGVEVSA